MNRQITVNAMGNDILVEKGITLLELSKSYQSNFNTPIVLALVENNVKELHHRLKESCKVIFLDITSPEGYRSYQRSLSLLMIKAIRDIIDNSNSTDTVIKYSINSGFYCEIKCNEKPSEQVLKNIKKRMDEMVKQDIPFEKIAIKIDHAEEIFQKQNMLDKVKLFKYRRSSFVNVCKLDNYYDYLYGQMVPSTGCLSRYDIYLYDDGIILQFMNRFDPSKVAPFSPDEKLFRTLKRTSKWGEIMEVENVGELNDVIASGKINELMLVSEALMEKRIANIADKIIDDIDNKKFVFIAGPSSSGKTTFAHRLSIQLRAHGVKPHAISIDDYFVNRENTPKDEDGKYNFECLEAIDLEKFNEDMNNLLAGKTVEMPVFNFITGKREYKGNYLTLEDSSVLVIEGIHGLNQKLSYAIPESNKFKIYISALTQLSIDNHNRISTTDARLIRRMVRDYQYRGASATRTIEMWESVRRGEEKNIFPFQEQADVMFNSALIYELCILKQFAEPLLFNVPKDCKEYIEARRLIKFLDYFLGVSSDKIPYNSLLREFVGGSCF